MSAIDTREVTVRQEILSDQSAVYNVHVYFGDEQAASGGNEVAAQSTAVFACVDEQHAELLAEALRECSWFELR